MTNKTHTILIVEDEEHLREILEKKLALEGFEVLTAKDGEEGLNLALDEEPDLILLDILMPKKDGYAMLEELRGHERGKMIPVILLSNLDSTEAKKATLGHGAIDYIVKSYYDPQMIVTKIKERLNCL